MKKYQKFLISGIILFFLSSFRLGNKTFLGTNQQTSDWNTYTVKEITFSLPDFYQSVEPDNSLIEDMDDIDTILFMAFDTTFDTEDTSMFMIGERYKPEYFDFHAYALEVENQYEEIYQTTVNEDTLFGEIQSAVIYAKDHSDESGWFNEQTYLIATNTNLYEIRFLLFTQEKQTEIPYIYDISNTIEISPEDNDEEYFNPICIIGLSLFLILFGFNIWIRRKKKNAIIISEETLRNI